MNPNFPKAVLNFEYFLREVGLVCERREQLPTFGESVVQYGSARIRVRVASDRGVWYVEIADVAAEKMGWYDAALLRDLLVGPGEDVLPLVDQIKFLEKYWSSILECFREGHAEATHTALESLRNNRAIRPVSRLLLSHQWSQLNAI